MKVDENGFKWVKMDEVDVSGKQWMKMDEVDERGWKLKVNETD